MSLNDYNPSYRYRARNRQKMTNAMSMVIVILFSAAVGFWMGRQFGAGNVINLTEQLKTLTTQNTLLQDTVTELRAEAQVANTRYEQIKQEYNAAIPEGPVQDLIKIVREQLDQGMDPQRLSFFIKSARPPTGCTEPEIKRFVVTTPAYKGGDSTVSVADGAIVITGTGTSARNAKGEPEAWFDPAQKVKITFSHDQKSEVKESNLPIRHSVVAGNREYRFTIEEGSRSFVKVAFDSCAYP
ncbi:MAG: hypothetical protein J0L77_03560 [Alphaproteobacteria bacterium]|nr:hypothetical protein [Alphaproteobacteria bacterium]